MEAITREEKIMSGENLTPITRKEMFLAKAAGMDVETPEPITREEMFLSKISGGGSGGGNVVIQPLTITENGTYTAEDGVDGYSPVTVEVAASGGYDVKKFVEGGVAEAILPNVTKIKNYAFNSDSDLTFVSMPNVLSIGQWAFSNCNNLELTSLPSFLTSLGSNAFSYCTKLALTSLPSGLTVINASTFNACKSLALTSLPDGVTEIRQSAFYGCSNLALTALPRSLKTIGQQAFCTCSKLAITAIPSGVKIIGLNAFSSCSGLNSITFEGKPDSIALCFSVCNNLKTINVPWAEGEVSGAPWGATNATINYNYTGG